MAKHPSKSFREELPNLLNERGLSLRALARAAGVGHDQLSRALSGDRNARASGDLAQAVSRALSLPDDYFAEARLAQIMAALRQDHQLLDRVYDRFMR
jgi:transcriptional regulator with XRE-family HTH domain